MYEAGALPVGGEAESGVVGMENMAAGVVAEHAEREHGSQGNGAERLPDSRVKNRAGAEPNIRHRNHLEGPITEQARLSNQGLHLH